MRRRFLSQRVRLRLEMTVFPAVRGVGIQKDRKLTALSVLLSERFGLGGIKVFEEWAYSCAADQESQKLELLAGERGENDDDGN